MEATPAPPPLAFKIAPVKASKPAEVEPVVGRQLLTRFFELGPIHVDFEVLVDGKTVVVLHGAGIELTCGDNQLMRLGRLLEQLTHTEELVRHHRETERLGTALADKAMELLRAVDELTDGAQFTETHAAREAAVAFLSHQWPDEDHPTQKEAPCPAT